MNSPALSTTKDFAEMKPAHYRICVQRVYININIIPSVNPMYFLVCSIVEKAEAIPAHSSAARLSDIHTSSNSHCSVRCVPTTSEDP